MSKVLVQLLLSMVVGVSAAVGFGPQAIKIRQEAKASLRETIKLVFPSASNLTTQLQTNTTVSAQTQVKTAIKENVRVDARLRSNLNTRVTSNGTNVVNNVNLSPEVLLGGSTTTNAQTTVQANTQTTVGGNLSDVDLDLKNNVKTNLDLNLPLLP
jgi:hypothetical protein